MNVLTMYSISVTCAVGSSANSFSFQNFKKKNSIEFPMTKNYSKFNISHILGLKITKIHIQTFNSLKVFQQYQKCTTPSWRVSFVGPFFPISLSHTHYNPTHNTLSDMNYIHTSLPTIWVLGNTTSFILVEWVHPWLCGCFFGMDRWMDGWIPSIQILTSVDILTREKTFWLKQKSRVEPHVVDTWHGTLEKKKKG
jgi:hypothetical protein